MVKENNVIIAHDLVLGYQGKTVVSNLSLEIKKGEFIGILGPNGSGKSTFLRALIGFIKPIAGDLLVLGKKPRCGNVKIGYMPQQRQYDTVENLTSYAILDATYNGTSYGFSLPYSSKKQEIYQVLETVGAGDYAKRPFQQLSGGEKQRVYLAQSILGNPDILLLDEPLSNLDPHYQETFINLLHEIQHKLNATILFTAHDPNPLIPVINRVLYFAKGKAVVGEIEEIITSHTLSKLYETNIEVVKLKNRLFVLGDNHNMLGEAVHHHG